MCVCVCVCVYIYMNKVCWKIKIRRYEKKLTTLKIKLTYFAYKIVTSEIKLNFNKKRRKFNTTKVYRKFTDA